jgi:branched-chain amino acid transport system ATP-binding protein
MSAAIELQGIKKSFGDIAILRDISLSVAQGERHALIGPNGAGKTTLINLLTGALQPSSGMVLLEGADITNVVAAERVRRGLVRTFQVNTLFPHLSPLEATALAIARRHGLCLNPLRALKHCSAVIAEARDLLGRFDFGADAARPTRELPYGRQRLLEIALALAADPKVLLLDEPAAGVPAGESDEIFAALNLLPRDIAVLFIEHDMDVVFRFAERITVMNAGQILREGTPDEIADDAEVREVYLGEDGDV